MADALFLSFWFPSFELDEMLPRALAVMRQFPFSRRRLGSAMWLYILSRGTSQRFSNSVSGPDSAGRSRASGFRLLHEDYAYLFEAYWDLWISTRENSGRCSPQR